MDFTFNQAFGNTATCVMENGAYVYSKTSSYEKDKLEFYSRLYAEGLLDADYVTTKWDTMEPMSLNLMWINFSPENT